MAHMVITRRCNLACGYCHEYDKTSAPVPLAELKLRVDHIAKLRTVFVTLTGGESLLHPDLVQLVAYVRARGMTPLVNTNGFLLTRDNITRLGEAGLYGLQLSIDTVEPNRTTKKSLKTLLPKLRLLAEHATFRVRINSVLGAEDPDQAVEVARVAVSLGFDAKCSLVRDGHGAVMKLDARGRRAYDEIRSLGARAPRYLSEDFQAALIDDGEVEWKCRGGARYFTVCEDGLVHLCESSYGSPGKPLAEYGQADIEQAFHMRKSCSVTCAVAYAHQASRVDRCRRQDDEVTTICKRSWFESSQERQAPGPIRSASRSGATS